TGCLALRRAAVVLVSLAPGEGGQVARGVAADFRAGDDEDLGAVHGAQHLAPPGRYPGPQEQAVEVDALIAQRVALVDADYRGREARDVLGGGKRGPGDRVALVE